MTTNSTDFLKNIIRESIENVICIDEEYIEPYEDSDDKEKTKRSREIYSLFSDSYGCNTEMVSFKKDSDNWKNKLKRQDLLVLDWQLTTEKDDRVPLSIIDYAIENNTQYVCVFTNNAGAALTQIRQLVMAYYSGFNKEEMQEISDRVMGAGISDSEVKTLLRDFISTEQDINRIKKSLKEMGISPVGGLDFNDYNTWNKLFCIRESGTPDYSRYKINGGLGTRSSFSVGGTYIFFLSKGGKENKFDPTAIVQTIYSELLKLPSSVFDILWIYYYNLLRKSLYNRNNLPMRVSADSLKYFASSAMEHKDGDDAEQAEEDFFSSLMDLVIDEVSECAQANSSIRPPKRLIKELEEGAIEIGYDDVANELMKINAVINCNKTLTNSEHEIILGDVFSATLKEDNKEKEVYLMCVSALCDCANHNRLGNMYSYSFIRGMKKTDATYGKSGNPEELYISFVWEEDPFYIEWGNKLYGGYIAPRKTRVNREKPIKVFLGGKALELKYVCTIKEKFAQRMANHVFSWGHRVGTSFAKRSEKERTTIEENATIAKAEKILRRRESLNQTNSASN